MVGNLIPWLVGLPTLLSALAGMNFVREGERALKLRFNKAIQGRDGEYKVAGPGFLMMVPIMHKLERIDIRLRTLLVPEQSVTLQNGDVYVVGAVIRCRVKEDYSSLDLYNVAFKAVPDINLALIEFSKAMVHVLLAGRDSNDPAKEQEEIVRELLELLQEQASEWGMEITGVNLTDCRPNAETINRKTAREVADRMTGPIATVLAGLPWGVSQNGNNDHTVHGDHDGTDRTGNLVPFNAAHAANGNGNGNGYHR
jgi:regulator of protease activity HflC (stomatin/prohibitin superfamily)